MEKEEEKEGEKRGTPRGRRHRATPFRSVHHRREEAAAMPVWRAVSWWRSMIDQVVVPADAARDDDRACCWCSIWTTWIDRSGRRGPCRRAVACTGTARVAGIPMAIDRASERSVSGRRRPCRPRRRRSISPRLLEFVGLGTLHGQRTAAPVIGRRGAQDSCQDSTRPATSVWLQLATPLQISLPADETAKIQYWLIPLVNTPCKPLSSPRVI